ncbi:DNA polymerase III subunit gamma/tau [Microbacterium sp. 18062]|uniref:DNA polymerase III subunit gamma/tau n=1 Tax=Microbacterium sp. 18062 TaxID=2681410 RepID=UPI00135871B2|nr:DNA polymerase III subunit gamma/tau [Microbacterium sp. 18062]
MAGRDDDALSWGGDDDPTLDVGVPASAPETTPRADTAPDGHAAATGSRAEPASTTGTPADAAPAAPMDNVTLVSLGVLGGVYLLLAIGWFIGGSRLQLIAQLFLEPNGYLVAWLLAVVAPAIWFGTILLTTRGSRTWLRILLLVVGAVLLLPWPFLMVGVGG